MLPAAVASGPAPTAIAFSALATATVPRAAAEFPLASAFCPKATAPNLLLLAPKPKALESRPVASAPVPTATVLAFFARASLPIAMELKTCASAPSPHCRKKVLGVELSLPVQAAPEFTASGRAGPPVPPLLPVLAANTGRPPGPGRAARFHPLFRPLPCLFYGLCRDQIIAVGVFNFCLGVWLVRQSHWRSKAKRDERTTAGKGGLETRCSILGIHGVLLFVWVSWRRNSGRAIAPEETCVFG